jgi:hypothetical protein
LSFIFSNQSMHLPPHAFCWDEFTFMNTTVESFKWGWYLFSESFYRFFCLRHALLKVLEYNHDYLYVHILFYQVFSKCVTLFTVYFRCNDLVLFSVIVTDEEQKSCFYLVNNKYIRHYINEHNTNTTRTQCTRKRYLHKVIYNFRKFLLRNDTYTFKACFRTDIYISNFEFCRNRQSYHFEPYTLTKFINIIKMFGKI